MRETIPRYDVYGVTIGSDYPFAVPLPTSTSPVDLHFEVSEQPPDGTEIDQHAPIYVEGKRSDGRPHFEFYALEDRDVVRLTGAADFHLWPDRIHCHLVEPRHRYLVEVAMFGMIMSLWLERRGTLTLHGSTVVIGGEAVAFLSRQGGGKTSTAAACVAAGHALLSDDLLALERADGRVMAQPGYPQLRMWPEQARHFVGTDEGHPTFHPAHDKRRVMVGQGFGTFAASPVPLARLYLPRRSTRADAEVEIRPLTPRDALMALVGQSFLPRETMRYGLQPARLRFLADLLRTVVVSELIVPLGLDQLARVSRAIEADLGR